jgi:hypothetical protein
MFSVVMLTVIMLTVVGPRTNNIKANIFLIFVIETPFVVNKLACLLEQATSL